MRACAYAYACVCTQEFARRLMEEQNAEYEASLAADRQREEGRQAERRRQVRETMCAIPSILPLTMCVFMCTV